VYYCSNTQVCNSDLHGGRCSIYQQIVNQVRYLIAAGRLGLAKNCLPFVCLRNN